MEKKCKYCGSLKNETEFGVCLTKGDKVYRRRKCNSCYRKTKNAYSKVKVDWLRDYKSKLKCSICGFSDYRALQFHHVNEDKEHNISNMIRQYSIDNVLLEIAKCDVLCANCHMIHHFNEFTFR